VRIYPSPSASVATTSARPPYSSETNFGTISGKLEIGGVSRDVLSNQTSRFPWSIAVVAAMERDWLDWVARAGLKDDPDAPHPMRPNPGAKQESEGPG
jgi:hypothetical protein